MEVTGIVWVAGAVIAVAALARLVSARRAQLVKELRRQVGKKIPSESLPGGSDEETA